MSRNAGRRRSAPCRTGYVGAAYEIEIESEEGSGCTSPGNPYVWYEIKNSSLSAGAVDHASRCDLGHTHERRIHALLDLESRLDFCRRRARLVPARKDRSEREFSIYIDPGLEIQNETLKGPTIGQPYSDTLTAKQVVSLNPPTGSEVQASWSVESGALPPGLALSPQGLLTGTPTTEGSSGFVIRAQSGSRIDSKTYALAVRQPLSVISHFGPARPPSSEVGIRVGKTFTATGGSGPYSWALVSGALPPGVVLDPTRARSQEPPEAGAFAFGVTATDSEGRVTTSAAALTVAPRLAIKTLRSEARKGGKPVPAEACNRSAESSP